MQKFDRRIVVRNNLTDLEAGIIFLEKEGWVLDPTVPDEKSGTLLGTLKAIRAPGFTNVFVSMRRQIHEPVAATKTVVEVKPVIDPEHPEVILEATSKQVPK